jgi:hypothetical protein
MRIPPAARGVWLTMGLASLVAASTAFAADAQPSDAATRTQITALLKNFLSPAVMATAAGHDRFWADDLVYTSSKGEVMHKADIMKSFADAPKPASGKSATPKSASDQSASGKTASRKSANPDPVFTAEDILVRPYGDTAALTFRLVEHDPDGKISTFRNSGMFVKRGGKWQAVTWQATRVAGESK